MNLTDLFDPDDDASIGGSSPAAGPEAADMLLPLSEALALEHAARTAAQHEERPSDAPPTDAGPGGR